MSGPRRAFVAGWPIAHSRSPLIHGHWIAAYGVEGTYEPVAVPPETLNGFLETVRAGDWCGGNITIPHKHAAFAAADECDTAALAIGAANTLVSDRGRLYASNTDAAGYIANLDATVSNWRKNAHRAVVLGAGGAARAVVWALLQEGVGCVRLVNRTRDRAEDLAAGFGPNVEVTDWRDRNRALQNAGLLVNTTSLGMAGMAALDLDLALLPLHATVSDIVYTPLVTPLLAAAAKRGNPVVDGLGMLLHQAVPGFKAWFGIFPEVTDELRDLVLSDIGR